MGQILHGSATTTEAVRRAIQNSQASLRELAGRYGINPKTVAKWRRRSSVCDARMGPREPRSTVLSNQEEALVVALPSGSRWFLSLHLLPWPGLKCHDLSVQITL